MYGAACIRAKRVRVSSLYYYFRHLRPSVRHAPESFVSLEFDEQKAVFILSTLPLILGKFAKLGHACEYVTLLAIRFDKF